MPSLGAYAEQESDSTQLPTGTYWYNGDVSFSTIDKNNGFTAEAWDDYRDTGFDGAGNALGIAGSFHLVAFDSLSASKAVYGNVLAKQLTDNADLGTDSRFGDLYGHSTLSYIQDYQGNCSHFGATSFEQQAVVFGSNYTTFGLFAQESGGHQIINYKNSSTQGTVVKFPAIIGQDLDSSTDPFIDLDTLKQEMKSLSAGLAQRSAEGGATYDFSNASNKQIEYMLDSGCAYLELSASELAKSGDAINIVGLPDDGSGALVINVDCEGSSVTLPSQINLYLGDRAANFGEVDADTGYVLWNFYNLGDETSITATNLVGSILAPGASLTLNGNACGTFIADAITAKGNTSARPFHGSFEAVEATASVDISATMTWDDGADADGLRPDAVAVSIVRTAKDGSTQVVGTRSLSEANSWKASAVGLPAADSDGNEYSYALKQEDVQGYDGAVSLASEPTKDDFGNVSYEFSLVNTHKAKTVGVKVKMEWKDGGNAAGNRPDSVTARLYVLSADGQKTPVEGAADKVLSSKNDWTATWTELPANKAGERIDYTVDEVDVPEGYELTDVTREQTDDGYVFTITNSAKAAAPTPSEGGEQDSSKPSTPNPSKPSAQSADGSSSKSNVQSGSRSEVTEKVASSVEQRGLAKTGDGAPIGVAALFAAGLLCLASAARRTRHGKRG